MSPLPPRGPQRANLVPTPSPSQEEAPGRGRPIGIPALSASGSALLVALLLGLACASAQRSAPVSDSLRSPQVALGARWELVVPPELTRGEASQRAFHLSLERPGAAPLQLHSFFDGEQHRLRYTPRTAGTQRFVLQRAADAAPIAEGVLHVTPGEPPVFIRVANGRSHLLERPTGEVFRPLGENRFNVYDPRWNYAHLAPEAYIARMGERGMNTLRIFLQSDCEDESLGAGALALGCLEPEPGRFDPQVAERVERLLTAGEAHGVRLIITLFAVGFTPGPDEQWKSWLDNPYSTARGGPVAEPEDFFDRPELALPRLRYVLDRWGSSPALLAVDLLNEPEWDGNIGEETWLPWARELSRVWKAEDVHGHPVTVGSVGLHWNVGGDERTWWADPACDIVQWHLYGKEVYQVHALAAELTRKVQETWRYGKPILVGEFGYGDEDQRFFDHTHVGIWTATFAGAGALSHSAPRFTPDSDVPMTPARARHFRVLADFLATLPPRDTLLPAAAPRAAPEGARAWMLGDGPVRAVWIMGPKRGYGTAVEGGTLHLEALPAGAWQVRFVDDVSGQDLGLRVLQADGGPITVALPPYVRHLALTLRALESTTEP